MKLVSRRPNQFFWVRRQDTRMKARAFVLAKAAMMMALVRWLAIEDRSCNHVIKDRNKSNYSYVTIPLGNCKED